ncbi:MAG TPA: hypothetical protein VJW73_15525 [Gemmatimonadaceae bacterium]|nr:hypothetical protein [Gemmatimonadaceae bacterium]
MRLLRRASLLVAVSFATRASAQLPPAPLPLSNTEDARTLPAGSVLFRVLNAWTRFDEVYDAAADSANHLHPLGQSFSAIQLGVRQFPGLATAESALRTLTGDPTLSLNLGQTLATANTRIVTTPLMLQYGVTDRLTIGAMVPVVQTHSTVFVELNPRSLGTPTTINAGPNPVRSNNAAAIQANTALLAQLKSAHDSLTDFVTRCQQSNCGSLGDANQALATTDAYLAAVKAVYGTDSQASLFAPFGTAQAQIVANLATLQNTVNGLFGSNYFTFGPPAAANAIAAQFQLQQLATANPGVAFDSLGSPDRIGIGDVEVSARFKLLDGFADTTGGMKLRATLIGVARIGTGRPPSGMVPFEVGTGTGQTSADGGAIVDMRFGRRLMATFGAQYTSYFTSSDVARLPNSDYALFPLDVPIAGSWREGDAVQVEATPRIALTDYITFFGAYTFRHQAASKYTSPDASVSPVFAATTEQRAGLGFGYSTVTRYARGQSSLPIELSFTHLETLTATGGLVPKYGRDQIELRIYYRLRRAGR